MEEDDQILPAQNTDRGFLWHHMNLALNVLLKHPRTSRSFRSVFVKKSDHNTGADLLLLDTAGGFSAWRFLSVPPDTVV